VYFVVEIVKTKSQPRTLMRITTKQNNYSMSWQRDLLTNVSFFLMMFNRSIISNSYIAAG